MSPGKITKSFFSCHKIAKCPECHEGILLKDISCVLSKPLDDDYVNILFWEQESKAKTFILAQSSGAESSEDVFINNTPEIKNLSSLKNACKDLSRYGYHINNVYLNTECSDFDCHFLHRIDLLWSSDKKNIVVVSELVSLNDLALKHDYDSKKSNIVVHDSKTQNYAFDILNLPIKKYDTLKNKIKQILLIG